MEPAVCIRYQINNKKRFTTYNFLNDLKNILKDADYFEKYTIQIAFYCEFLNYKEMKYFDRGRNIVHATNSDFKLFSKMNINE